MAKINTLETTTPLEQLVTDVSHATTAHVPDDDQSAASVELASQLVFASMDDSLSEQQPAITPDRRTRKAIRALVPDALDYIQTESDGDTALETELRTNLIHSLGRIGIYPDTIPELAPQQPDSPAPAHRQHQKAPETVPQLTDHDRDYLESLVAEVATSGTWSSHTTQAAATGFIDIYHPAEQRASHNRGTHQEILNAIAACGAYSHAVATALSYLAPLEQTSRIDDMKTEITRQLLLRADQPTRQRLEASDAYTLANQPEIQEFMNAIKGAQYEILAHDAIAQHSDLVPHDSLSYSSLEDDIAHGFDIQLTQADTTYYIDIKAARSFHRSVKKYPAASIVAGSAHDNFVVRRTRHPSHNDRPHHIIVIDAETTGGIAYRRNRLSLTTPKHYLATLTHAIKAVDNNNK